MAAPPGATPERLPQYDYVAQPGADQPTSLGAAVGKTLGSEARLDSLQQVRGVSAWALSGVCPLVLPRRASYRS